jgi:hypothetical protein
MNILERIAAPKNSLAAYERQERQLAKLVREYTAKAERYKKSLDEVKEIINDFVSP